LKPVFLDTGFIVASLDRSDRHNAACVQAIRSLSAPLMTCEAVIAEACYLLRRVRPF
jgi:predicted nucleic acid-binding protein